MSILKDESIFKEYYDMRKEVHDQEIFEKNKELHHIEENVAKCEDDIFDFCKKYIKDEKTLEELNKKFSKYELAFGKEMEVWCENHFEWGLETMAKAKKEIKLQMMINFFIIMKIAFLTLLHQIWNDYFRIGNSTSWYEFKIT